MLLQTSFSSEFSIIPQITTAIGLVAFVLAIVFYYLRTLSSNELEKIKSSKDEDKANLIRILADKYDIPTENLLPGQKYKLLQQKLELDYRKRNQTFIFSGFITIILAIVISIIIFHNPEPPKEIVPAGESAALIIDNFENGDTIKIDNPIVRGRLIGNMITGHKLYGVLKIGNAYSITTPFSLGANGNWEYQSNIGVNGNVEIGVLECNEKAAELLNLQLEKKIYSLPELTDGMKIIGAVAIYKK